MKQNTFGKQKQYAKWISIIFIVIAVTLFTSGDISSSQVSFTSGTTISASDMNTNFDALFNLVSGNIDNTNLASDADSLEKVSGGLVYWSAGDIIKIAGDLEVTGDLNLLDDLFIDKNVTIGGSYNSTIDLLNNNSLTTIYLDSDYSTGGYIGMRDNDGTQRIHIRTDTSGGSIEVNGTQVNDYAEVFELSYKDSMEPGTVVILDPDHPGKLCISLEVYDKKVAGIVSCAGGLSPGMVIGSRKDGTNDKPVALSGRVYCKVDTTNGAIEVGDLLTTSENDGYAMKVTDFSRAQGAILGKAMEPFSGDKGMILVLVTLQ